MSDEIEKAIKMLIDRVTNDASSGAAVHYTQAALNLAHVAATLANTKKHLE